MKQDVRYGVKLAILYGMIWFVDLLDASLLNIALPEVSRAFQIDPTSAEWVLVGFLLAIAIGMLLSNPASHNFGVRRVFIGAQWLYVISSIGCGLAPGFSELVLYRVVQGFGGGLAIPVGMNLIMSVMPKKSWAKTGSWLNVFSLLAPALGPILAGYIMTALSWRWLFFIKIPLSVVAVLVSHFWVRKSSLRLKKKFDWFGFFFIAISLSCLLLVLTEAGKALFSLYTLLTLFILAITTFAAFIWQEKRAEEPLITLEIFRLRLFTWGNVVQSAANMIFLGSTFIVALYLQWGVGLGIVETGWIMAAITLGMMAVMPITGKYYNTLGPLPFIICGLILMSGAMFALIFVTKQTPYLLIALIIFCEGAGSAALQTTNFVSIFSEVPERLKGMGSSIYSLFKQISASFGIAFTTLALTLSMRMYGVETLTLHSPKHLFYYPLILLGLIPLVALVFCPLIDNSRALEQMNAKEESDD